MQGEPPLIPCTYCRWKAQTPEGMARHLAHNHPIGKPPGPADVAQMAERTRPLDAPDRTVRLYLRVSTDDQTTENQRLRCEPAIAGKGWTNVVKYAEPDGTSGATIDRPELRKLMHDLRPGDVVVIQKADRLSRSTRDFIELTTAIHARGAELWCVDQQIDTTTPFGMAFWRILGVFAELELALIVQRTRDGIARARAQGKHVGRHKAGCGFLFPCPWGIDHKARAREREGKRKGGSGQEPSLPGKPPSPATP